MLNSFYQETQKNAPSGKDARSTKTIHYSDLLSDQEKKIIDNSKDFPVFQKTERNNKKRFTATSIRRANTFVIDEKKEAESHKIIKALEDLAQGGESYRVWSKNLLKLTSYVNGLLRSIFDNLYQMPMGMRIVCKLISTLVLEKYPTIKQKDHHQIIAKVLCTNWIVPQLLNPEVYEIIDESSKCRFTISEATRLFQRVIFQDTYNATESLAVLNPYIEFFKTSVENYFEVLLDINCNTIQELIKTDNTLKENTKKISIRSLCLSVEEIKTLSKNILANENKIKEIDSQAPKLAKQILDHEKEFPISMQKTPLEQVYVNYFDIKFPKSTTTSYVEEFLKIQNYNKDMPEDQKLVAKCKHILKQILLAIEDIKDLSIVSGHDELTIEDILMFSQERINTKETKLIKRKRHTSVHLSSRFLLTYIKKLDPSYRNHNFQRLFTEMVQELTEQVEKIYTKAQNNKVQLLRGIDSLKRRNEQLREVELKKIRNVHRSLIRDFLNSVKLHICLRAPAHPSAEDKVQICHDKDCYFGKLAFINELTNSTVVNLTSPKSDLKKKPISSPTVILFVQAMALNFVFFITKLTRDPSSDFHEHCTNLDSFIEHFSSIPAVREAVTGFGPEGSEHNGVSDTYSKFLQLLFDIASHQLQKFKDEDKKLALEEIENYVGKKLCLKIFPSHDRADEAFWMRCKTLEWLSFNHLDIPETNRCPEIWNYVAQKFSEIDYKLTPISKINTILEAFNTISYVINLATLKTDFGADDLTPIVLYTMVRWCPKKIYSNLNFTSRFRHDYKRMLQEQGGYYIENLRGAVTFLENLTHTLANLDYFEFEKLMHEKEMKYEIYFLRNRPRSEREVLTFSAVRSRKKAKTEQVVESMTPTTNSTSTSTVN